ncbi:MAG: UDP diphospho-muramoyl pentapeptide beta-N acetylglucosaminyl transferase [Parcubacteria group bacterium GW2011_GWA2_50_10b]|nr:MAG: UDP diphospho-muramoyl pentapeptide beta-N acetylglucosaminyl transferase [Parcubacteria group bacterium GW2011_GWA2_50_10b]
MRILFTGGGTGGHFYPIISVAQELQALAKEKRLLDLELFYLSPTPYNPGVLYETGITYKKNSAGKLRRYFSLLNFLDLWKTLWGVIISTLELYSLYPDVVFGKGGYASFPALLAARLLHIPVVIHESDTVPGRVNLWAGKFAQRVAVSYKEAAKYFPAGSVAYTGQPVRKEIANPITEGAREFLKLEEDVPVILILGGSQGAQKINDAVLGGLKELVEKYAVIHQAGERNIAEVSATGEAVLFGSSHKDRYKPYDYLNPLALRMAAGVASVVISRAGSTIFEIAAWRVPAIIIPINERVSRDQRSNAFAYARSGACEVIEEGNLTPNILVSELERLVNNEETRQKMKEAARSFYKPDAARLVAEEILKIALEHEVEK